jgi:hypothetical protein
MSGLIPQVLVCPRSGIVEPGVGKIIWQTAFALFDVIDEASDIEVGAAPTTGGGYGGAAGSAKDELLATVALEGDVSWMPFVDLAKRDLARLVVRFDALDDPLRHGLLPLPAARRIRRRLTKDSVVSLILQSLYHIRRAYSSLLGRLDR